MIYAVLITHWIADFIIQTDWQAKNKSKSLSPLAHHISTYTLCLLPFGWQFALINGASHFIIDYFTSKGSSYFFKKQDYHKAFIVIGFDQLLHTIILIYTTGVYHE